jgi:hypothetical protein
MCHLPVEVAARLCRDHAAKNRLVCRHHHSPTVAFQPAGQGSRGAPRARNGYTTALLATECQSFLDNVIAGFGPTGSWNDPYSAQGESSLPCSCFCDPERMR